MDHTTELIKKFQEYSVVKNEIIKNDVILQQEIVERLKEMSKKEFFMSIVNTNPKNNKKFSFKYIQDDGDLIEFLEDYSVLNGFFKFLPTYKTKRIKELNKNVEECGIIVRQIIEQFNPLIKNIIAKNFLKRYSYISNNYGELFAGGINGLVSSIYKFDCSKNVKFITHAYRWIIYYIYREMDDVVKTYNDKLYDDDSFFDTLQVDETFEENMINNAEIDKLKKIDLLDKYEERLLELVLVEKIKLEDIDKVVNKINLYLNDDMSILADYIKA